MTTGAGAAGGPHGDDPSLAEESRKRYVQKTISIPRSTYIYEKIHFFIISSMYLYIDNLVGVFLSAIFHVLSGVQTLSVFDFYHVADPSDPFYVRTSEVYLL